MSRLRFIAATGLVMFISGCSSGAPQAPIGLAKRPANSSVPITAPPVERAAEVETSQPAAVLPAGAVPTRFTSRSATRDRIVISDYSAPGGIQTLPASELTSLILAAREAKSVTLYCRGDKAKPSRAQRAALLQKGAATKAFLVAQGIAPEKIKVLVLSAGGFVADNSTSTGRAKNRRIEIRIV